MENPNLDRPEQQGRPSRGVDFYLVPFRWMNYTLHFDKCCGQGDGVCAPREVFSFYILLSRSTIAAVHGGRFPFLEFTRAAHIVCDPKTGSLGKKGRILYQFVKSWWKVPLSELLVIREETFWAKFPRFKN
jgi:hypothetical protein